ncbi:MAG TPA: hypothetical protein VMA31_14205 [Bryobacteraceae bacterium]|jgi:hypothetical protein|nr:hypothetical protein [Bryobacteraceae bacterium]
MFDSLDEKIRHDDELEVSRKERILKWAAIAILSILLFGGVYVGVHILE